MKIKTKNKAFKRLMKFINLQEYVNVSPKAAFRNNLYKSNLIQNAWLGFLMKFSLPVLVTIKLPEWHSCHITTKNYYKSLSLYRDIILEIEREFTGKGNHWRDVPLPFIGSFQKTRSGTWVFYLLIKVDSLNIGFLYKLCLAIQTVIDKHCFDEEVIDIRPVTQQEGIALFVVKNQKYNEDLTHDEGNSLFTLEVLFHVKEKPNNIRNFIQDSIWSVVEEILSD